MTTYNVSCWIGTVYATVEAESEDDAPAEALQQLNDKAIDILAAATFEVRESEDV